MVLWLARFWTTPTLAESTLFKLQAMAPIPPIHSLAYSRNIFIDTHTHAIRNHPTQARGLERKELMQNRRNAVVIGAGFGGLAAAIRLQALGFQTTLLEKNTTVGGRASQIIDKGYTFDAGPSLVTAPAILDDVFKAAGTSLAEQFKLQPLDPYYRVYFHDHTFIDYTGDAESMKSQMRQFNPADAEAYDRFMQDAEPVLFQAPFFI